jgi:HEAT repeat protein
MAQDDSDDVEIRKQAVFALSQRPKDEGIPALISVVGSTKSREVKRNALFWLAESNDPRAVELFEKILTQR